MNHELLKIQSTNGQTIRISQTAIMKALITSNTQGKTVERKCAYPCCIIQHEIYFIVSEPIVQNGTPEWKIKSYQVQDLQVRAFY